MRLYKLDLMYEGLSYQIMNTSAVNQAVCKHHYRKENISVGDSKEGRDTRF